VKLKLFEPIKRKKMSIALGVVEFAVFLFLYNMFELAVAWVYVFSISLLFCLANLVDAVQQKRAQTRMMINTAVSSVTDNAVEQEVVRAAMSFFWILAGVASLVKLQSTFAIWVLFAGAYAFRINALLTLKLRRDIDDLKRKGKLQ